MDITTRFQMNGKDCQRIAKGLAGLIHMFLQNPFGFFTRLFGFP